MTAFQRRQLDLMRQMETSFSVGSSLSTIVPMQSDFINDPQMALTCVAYIDKRIARVIQNKLIVPLKAIEPEFYYYPISALHLTIQNIRVIHDPPNFSPSDIAKVHKLLTNIIPEHAPFRFTFSGLLSMPTSTSVIALVRPRYDQFVKKLRAALIGIRVPDDKQYFTDELVFANTTFCRYTHTPSEQFLQKLQTMKDIGIGEFIADTMTLVEMNAGAHPSKTRVFGTFRFTGK